MFIAHKSNVIQYHHETEWQCRRVAKEMSLPEYSAWVKSITSGDPPVVTYPSEDFTIVECKDDDENVQERLAQLDDFRSRDGVYNIKWSNSKVNCEEVLDVDGKSQDPKVYVQSHFKGDDTAKDARILADEWTEIRAERDRLLTNSDWTQGNDTPLSDADKAKWTTYRGKLRTLPVDQSSKTTYADITWPTQP
jgi:hypothetical protein